LEALLLLGLGYEQKGMFEEAINQFNQAKEIHRDSAEPLELLLVTSAILVRTSCTKEN